MESPLHNFFDSQEKTTGFGLAARIAAPAATVRPNEAGTTVLESVEAFEEAAIPRLVIRGENHSKQPNPHSAFIDWLTFTFRYHFDATRSLIDIDEILHSAFGFGLGICLNRKHSSYEQSWVLGNGYGIFATGGDDVGGTSLVSLTGEGCTVVRDWGNVYETLEKLKAKITRVDLSHDDYEGLISLPSAVEWYLAGDFHTGKGRPPSGELINDFDSGKGKTLYIGKRDNGKFLRIYEKGKQLGDPTSPWVRWELELKNADRVIPYKVVISPGPYLAAAYPCTAWISSSQCRIETSKKATKIGLEVLLRSCKISYGKLIWTLKNICGYSAEQIVEMLSVEGLPKRINHPVPGEVS